MDVAESRKISRMSPMASDVGLTCVIGGTSLLNSSLFSGLTLASTETKFGKASYYDGQLPSGRRIIFLQRHLAGPDASVYDPPHKIEHRRSFAALEQLGVTKIISICSVGCLNKEIKLNSVVMPDDYFYMFGPSVSFYDDKRGHIVPRIDSELRASLMEVLKNAETPRLHEGPATYVQTTGPRFETRAEVRFLSGLGDIVGMTAASEATMAAELNIPYAIVAMVDNMANGLADAELTSEQFHESVKRNQVVVENAVKNLLDKVA